MILRIVFAPLKHGNKAMEHKQDGGGTSGDPPLPNILSDDVRLAEAAKRGSPYLDTTQAAHYLRISPRTLQKKCREGAGPVVHWIGERPRFLVRELDEWSLRKL